MSPRTPSREQPYRWWPSYTPPANLAALGAAGRTWLRYVVASTIIVVPFLFAPVRRATHMGPLDAGAVSLAFCVWTSISVALQRTSSRFLSFHFVVAGNLLLNTSLALALAVVPGDPQTPLWCFACAYACMNAAGELEQNVAFLAAHTILPLLSIPIFLARGADPTWSVAGPALCAGASALGYHVIALHTSGALAMRKERDAALERVRRLEEERTRDRIARDLHDSIGPALSVAAWYGELLERGVPEGEMAQVAEGLRVSAREGLADLRAILGAIAPASGTLTSLAAEFRAVGQRLRAAADVDVAVREPEVEVELDAATRVTLARVFREATHNAVRHGRAKRIDVSLAVEAAAITLVVADDGHGVAASASPGRGLVGMHARASELGGEFALDTRPDGGTSVRIALPLPA